MKITMRAEKESITKEAITCILTIEEIQESAREYGTRKLSAEEISYVIEEVRQHFEKTSPVVKKTIEQLINAIVI